MDERKTRKYGRKNCADSGEKGNPEMLQCEM